MLAATLRLGPRSSAADFVDLASRAAAGETRRGPAAAGRRIARNGKKKEKKRERGEIERERRKSEGFFFCFTLDDVSYLRDEYEGGQRNVAATPLIAGTGGGARGALLLLLSFSRRAP